MMLLAGGSVFTVLRFLCVMCLLSLGLCIPVCLCVSCVVCGLCVSVFSVSSVFSLSLYGDHPMD